MCSQTIMRKRTALLRTMIVSTISSLNRESERIPRRLRRGKRANPKKTEFLTVEDSLRLAAGIFNISTYIVIIARYYS